MSGLLWFTFPVVDITAVLRLLGLIFSLALATQSYGQECSSFFGAESKPFNENLYAETLTQRIAKNNFRPHNTALERFFCKATGRTSLAGQLPPGAMPLLLRREFSSWENEAWEPGTAEQYGYDENGISVNTVFQIWDGESWLDTTQVVFENDDRGRRLTFTSQHWDGESWQNNSRRINAWNELDELVETVREDWIEGGWVARQRDLMSYENGLLVEEVLETYEGMKWNSAFRYSQEYDEQGRQVRTLSEYYNSSAMKWVANGQGTIEYGDDYSEESFQSWDTDAQEWFTYSRSVIEFNEQGDPVLVTHERRSPSEGWAFTSRAIHTYYDTGLEEELLIQRLEGTEWQNHGLYRSTYDDEGNMISRLWSSWETGQNTWSRRSMRTYIYNEATHVEDNEAYSLLSIELYPLPARDHVRIEVTLNEPTPLILDVYDLLGRQVVRLSEVPLATGMLRIDWQPANLAPGIYLARIHTGLRVETKRLVLVE